MRGRERGGGAGEPGVEFFDGGVHDFVFLFKGGGVGELELGEALFKGGEGCGVEIVCGNAGVAVVRWLNTCRKLLVGGIYMVGGEQRGQTEYPPPSRSPPSRPNMSPTAHPASARKNSLPHP